MEPLDDEGNLVYCRVQPAIEDWLGSTRAALNIIGVLREVN